MNNQFNLPLSVAVWLATDSYDHNSNPKHLSATGLLKSPKQVILSSRVRGENKEVDIMDLVASRMGTSIHDSIETAWKHNYKQALATLGYPQKVIDRIRINPKDELTPECLPVYMEIREQKQIDNWTISGKFDFIIEGRLQDFKSTGTYTYTNGHKEDDYVWQASIYRWLNPEKVTDEHFDIVFIFTNWSKLEAMKDKSGKYPQQKVVTKSYKLKSIAETEAFIRQKLAVIDKYFLANESDIPPCTDKQLARKESVYKYYSKPDAQRATKVFDSMNAAYRYQMDKKIGIIKEVKGKAYSCNWCTAAPICRQRALLAEQGLLPD